MKIVLVTGGFDPIHSGHIELLKAAKQLGDQLVVGLNSDDWLSRKKGQPFMPWEERNAILKELKCVDHVLPFDDSDDSAKGFITYMLENSRGDLIFANGGDRTQENIPEMSIQDPRLTFAFGVGGDDKKNSSSWILREWKQPKTKRPWGNYRILHELKPEVKVKELTVKPGASLSMQRHHNRQELWFVTQGLAAVDGLDDANNVYELTKLEKFDVLHIANNEWHQLKNVGEDQLKIVEIQFGTECIEEDIERKDNV